MKLRNLFAKKDEEYKNIDKKELKEIKKKYDNYKVEELTEEEFIEKFGEEAHKQVTFAPIEHKEGR